METPKQTNPGVLLLPECAHVPAHSLRQQRQCVALTGEDIVAHYLDSKGARILARNWRFGRLGELDIIAQDNKTLVAVEVKTRTVDSVGDPLEAITEQKLAQLRKLFRLWLRASSNTHEIGYLQGNNQQSCKYTRRFRIDAAAVLMMPGEKPHLRYLEGVG